LEETDVAAAPYATVNRRSSPSAKAVFRQALSKFVPMILRPSSPPRTSDPYADCSSAPLTVLRHQRAQTAQQSGTCRRISQSSELFQLFFIT